MNNLAIIETILRDRYRFFAEIREGAALNEKMRAMLVSSIAFFAGSTQICGIETGLEANLS